MRTLKELLIILLKKIETSQNNCLCMALSKMDVNFQEWNMINIFILTKAKPKFYQKRYYCNKGVFQQSFAPFYWTPGDLKSRQKWLKKQISKL